MLYDTLLADVSTLYRKGLTGVQIAQQLKVSVPRAYRAIHRAKVEVRPPIGNYRKWSVNEDYFERIDGHAKAQVLGMMYADGCNGSLKYGNRTVALQLAAEDKAYVEYVKAQLEYTGPVRTTSRSNRKVQDSVDIRVSSRKLACDLERLGCGPRKSLTLAFPTADQVPDEFLPSFMLGYFEGDGSIYCSPSSTTGHRRSQYGFGIIGTEHFCRRYGDILAQVTGACPYRLQWNGKVVNLTVRGNQQVPKVMAYLYAHAPFRMARKYARYQDLLKLNEQPDGRYLRWHPPAPATP